MKEARKHVRIAAQISVRFADERGGFVEENIGDISKGGVFVQTPNPRPRGEVVELFLRIPKSTEEITVMAEVMHVKPPQPSVAVGSNYRAGMGLRFTMIEPAQKDDLKKFLEKLIDGSGDDARQDARVYLCREIDVKPRSADDFKRHYLQNLSRGGLFIETDEEFTLFDPLEILLHPLDPSAEPLRLEGDVVHIRRKPSGYGVLGIGVKLVNVGKKIQRQIDAYIKNILASEAG